MGKKTLKGLTIKIGGDVTDLNKSLQSVNAKSGALGGELREINKLLKMDPTNTDILAQKQQVLAESIGNTEKKLDLLRNAEKQAQEQFARGDISEEQYRALQREIQFTENHLKSLKRQAKDTADAVEDLGKDADKAGNKIREQGKKTEDTAEKTREMDDAANDLASGGLKAVVSAAAAALTAIIALAEQTREYRTEMAKLDTAYTSAGYSTQAATKTYETLQGILGDTGQAVEAANMLAQLCTNEQELTEWTNILTGVYGTFGTSLPIEALAESANESARVGQITGNLADAINWAAAAGETFGVTMREATEENEAWNKAVQEATSAEDFFNLALQDCSTVQERQQLITKTLTGLYGNAAAQYKTTSAEIIKANEVTEKLNKVMAGIGSTVEPVITDIKDLGVTLLQDAEKPLEDIAMYIQRTVLPTIKSVSAWCKQNIPIIKSGLTAVAAGMVAYKAATIATTVAQKGLKGAILATTVAQKALNLVQAATPWGLVAVGVTAATVALMALTEASRKTVQQVDALTAEERELIAAADQTAAAFRDQRASTDETLGGITSQMDYVSGLAEELMDLASASGEVAEADQDRAAFILNELNDALGTEYTMIDGVIQKYGELEGSIRDVIQAKLANSLIEAKEADYTTAQSAVDEAWIAMDAKKKDYEAKKQALADADAAYLQAEADLEWAKEHMRDWTLPQQAYDDALAAWVEAQHAMIDAQTEWEASKATYASYVNTIITYEEAQAAALQGNYETAVQILQNKGGAYIEFSGVVDEESNKVLNTLYQEAIYAGLRAEFFRTQYENGVAGYTEEMVKEAEESYEKAMSAFSTAYADAKTVGEDIGNGMVDGAEGIRPILIEEARSLVTAFLDSARKAADSHSPSRKAIAIFEDIGEGGVIGLKNKTPDIRKEGENQAQAVLSAYTDPEISAQRVMRSVAEQQSAYTVTGLASAGSYNPLLEQILDAVRAGQVLVLDGDAVVGGTADRMNARLGELQILADRGAT